MTLMRAKPPAAFKTRSDIARYFGGNAIECLICGRRFKRLHTHLAAKHGMAADDYKKRFGLPWTALPMPTRTTRFSPVMP